MFYLRYICIKPITALVSVNCPGPFICHPAHLQLSWRNRTLSSTHSVLARLFTTNPEVDLHCENVFEHRLVWIFHFWTSLTWSGSKCAYFRFLFPSQNTWLHVFFQILKNTSRRLYRGQMDSFQGNIHPRFIFFDLVSHTEEGHQTPETSLDQVPVGKQVL